MRREERFRILQQEQVKEYGRRVRPASPFAAPAKASRRDVYRSFFQPLENPFGVFSNPWKCRAATKLYRIAASMSRTVRGIMAVRFLQPVRVTRMSSSIRMPVLVSGR